MMNLKYYLRGLGIGIIVTALILGFSVGGKDKTLSNEEIKEKAKALGMTEENMVLADLVSDDSTGEEEPEGNEEAVSSPSNIAVPASSPADTDEPESESVSPTPEQTGEPEETKLPEEAKEDSPSAAPSVTPKMEEHATPSAKPTASPKAAAEASPKQAPSATPMTEGTAISKDTITIQIVSGDTSYSISGKLEEAGLVDSAYEYDLYLCEKGYDKRLNVGTFEVPAGATPEEIAKILARME